MTNKRFNLIIVLFLIVTTLSAKGETVVITESTTSINLTEFASVTLVPREIELIQSNLELLEWKEFTNNALLFGNERSAYLIKTTFKNTTKIEKYVVSIQQPNIDHFEVFDEDFISLNRTGDIYEWSTREYKESYPSFSINLKEGENTTLYFLTYMEEDGVAPLWVYSESGYYENYSKREWFFGIFIGLMGVIALYNLLLYISIGEKIYIHYSSLVLSSIFAHSSLLSNSLGHFYGNSSFLSKYDTVIFPIILVVCAYNFILCYFSVSSKPKYIRVFSIILVAFILVPISILLTFLEIDQAFKILNLLFLLSYFYILFFAFTNLQLNSTLTVIFIAAWITLLAGSTVFALVNIGILSYSPIKIYIMPIGAALETIILSLALGYRIRILKKEKIETTEQLAWQSSNNNKLQMDFKEVELQVIRGQINPHFLFNAMNSIQFLIHKSLNKEASEYLSIFSRLMRQSLDFTEQSRIPINEEIKFVQDYIEIEKLRFTHPINFSVQLTENAKTYDISVPPLITQPFIENSIIHAFDENTSKGEIAMRVDVDSDEEYVLIEIEDNGKGLANNENTGHKSKGMSLSERRLKLINENFKRDVISFDVIDKSTLSDTQSGVIVKMSLPL